MVLPVNGTREALFAFVQCIVDDKPDALVLMPNPFYQISAGAIASRAYLEHALELADRYDFVIAVDECYAEIYLDDTQPPPSLLQACAAAGRTSFERCAVFHSLSKRSSVPGLRSGFVAGDP